MAEDPFAYKRDAKLQERLNKEVEALAKLPANRVCADCDETKRIRFCSVTLGTFLCNRCYGLHRQLGAHVTRCKCLGLDAWKLEEVALLKSVGNEQARAQYEANLPASPWQRPTKASSERQLYEFIRDKYERRKFVAAAVPPPATSQAPGAQVAAPLLVSSASATVAPNVAATPAAAPDLLGGWAYFDDAPPEAISAGRSCSSAPTAPIAASTEFDLLSLAADWAPPAAPSSVPSLMPSLPQAPPPPAATCATTAGSWAPPTQLARSPLSSLGYASAGAGASTQEPGAGSFPAGMPHMPHAAVPQSIPYWQAPHMAPMAPHMAPMHGQMMMAPAPAAAAPAKTKEDIMRLFQV